jgi:bacterioferritin
MSEDRTSQEELIERLNAALAWELRALTMYTHYAAYVRGIYRLHLKPFFEGEATESLGHANAVLVEIVKLGGEAVTQRDPTEIIHTTDYAVMLTESMKTERHAAESYQSFLQLQGLDAELFDAIEQIYFMEARSVEELNRLLP